MEGGGEISSLFTVLSFGVTDKWVKESGTPHELLTPSPSLKAPISSKHCMVEIYMDDYSAPYLVN